MSSFGVENLMGTHTGITKIIPMRDYKSLWARKNPDKIRAYYEKQKLKKAQLKANKPKPYSFRETEVMEQQLTLISLLTDLTSRPKPLWELTGKKGIKKVRRIIKKEIKGINLELSKLKRIKCFEENNDIKLDIEMHLLQQKDMLLGFLVRKEESIRDR